MQDVALWGRLGAAAVRHMRSFTPQEFAQTLWAFATAGVAYQVKAWAATVFGALPITATPCWLGNCKVARNNMACSELCILLRMVSAAKASDAGAGADADAVVADLRRLLTCAVLNTAFAQPCSPC